MKVSKKLKVRFDPLEVILSFNVTGGSLSQSYNYDTGEYEPDRGLTPVVITPTVFMTDPHGILPGGVVNDSISFAWKRNGASISGNSRYSVDNSESDQRGALTILENVQPGETVTLDFECSYLDSRKGELVKVSGTRLMNCETMSKEEIQVLLDKPSAIIFNPITDVPEVTIRAKAFRGDSEIDPSRVKFFLYKKIGMDPVAIDPSSSDDLEYKSFEDGVLTIDLRYIDKVKHYRIYAEIIPEVGDIPSAPTVRAASTDFSARRLFPEYEVDFDDYGRIQPWQETYKVDAVVLVNGTPVPEPSRFFNIEYFYNGPNHSISFGYGDTATLEFPTKVYAKESAVEIDFKEKRPLKAMSSKGRVFTHNGKYLTI